MSGGPLVLIAGAIGFTLGALVMGAPAPDPKPALPAVVAPNPRHLGGRFLHAWEAVTTLPPMDIMVSLRPRAELPCLYGLPQGEMGPDIACTTPYTLPCHVWLPSELAVVDFFPMNQVAFWTKLDTIRPDDPMEHMDLIVAHEFLHCYLSNWHDAWTEEHEK